MNNTLTGFKRYLSAAIVFLLGIVIALTVIGLPAYAAHAVSSENFTEPSVSLDISNKQFSESSGSSPASPTGWTGAGLSGSSSDGVVSGVISLDADKYHSDNKETDGRDKDVFKLERYPEYKSAPPQTPFGTNSFSGTNKNVLMINTADAETAYGYTSGSVTMAAASYYRVSVYVKTGNFNEGKGAFVKLNGLPEEVSFGNINTVKGLKKDENGLPVLNADNLYGFKKFTFYVATPLMTSSDVTLSLQVGDRVDDEDDDTKNYYNPAKGYAFFDNVEAECLSPNDFYSEAAIYGGKEDEGYKVYDFTSDAIYLNDGDIDYMYTGEAAPQGVTDIGSFENGLDGWTQIHDVEGATYVGALTYIYDTHDTFAEENPYNLSERPFSPVGNLDGRSKALLISSKSAVAVGYRSRNYTVLRNTYYRISYWVYTENMSGGSGASAVVRGTNGVADDDNELVVNATGLTGDTSNVMNYGWKQHAFYIKGSAIADYEIALELWLGQPTSLSSGVAMFDEIKLQKITPAEYNANNSSGTVVTFDPIFEVEGVANGRFFEVGDYEEYAYPLVPASWTKVTVDTAGTSGFATDAVESAKDAVMGVVSTDVEHFNANRGNYNNVSNPRPSEGNILMISSLEDTAVGYASPSLTVSSGSVYRLTATLRTAGVKGYGANLVLKSGNNVIATIEKITDTGNGFKTYTFYVEGGMSDYTVMLEIWLGMGDRTNNKSKLARGTIFVDNVTFSEASDVNYADIANSYTKLRATGTSKFDYATYSFGRIDFSAYDTYSNDIIRTPYNWSLALGGSSNTVYGIFDYTMLTDNTEIPATFKNEEDAPGGVLYLRNISPSVSLMTLNNVFSLPATSYYRIQVRLKVDMAENSEPNAVGAGLTLTGAEASFQNIKDTATREGGEDNEPDTEAFKTYTFYIKTGEASVDVGLTITLGDTTHSDQYFAGRLYINKITVTDIGSVAYESELSNFDEDSEGYSEYIKYNTKVDLSADDEDADEGGEEEPKGEIAWWLIPSILFAVAIVIAVVGTLVRRLVDKRREKKSVKVTTSYDRRNTLNKLHNQKSDEGDKVAGGDSEDTTYDEFDDTRSDSKSDEVAEEKNTAQETEAEKGEEPEEEPKEESGDSYDEFDDDKSEPEKSEESPAEEGAKTAESGETEKSESTDEQKKAKADAPAEKAAPAPKAPAKKSGYSDDFED